ncbi:hypothetical protein GCM10010149_62230 [Nonomuraea roseoviolacea subsp. roseoviolacea]
MTSGVGPVAAGGTVSGDWALTPATPVDWAQAPVSSSAPATAAHRPRSPDRMISTRVTVSSPSFTFVADRDNRLDTFSTFRALR